MYDAPTPAPPRRIVTAGDPLPRGSVALAVLGEMLNDAETRDAAPSPNGYSAMFWRGRSEALREARDRVAEAESRDR
jgi:hypothetical protein